MKRYQMLIEASLPVSNHKKSTLEAEKFRKNYSFYCIPQRYES